MSTLPIELREARQDDFARLRSFERSIEDALHWSESAWRRVLEAAADGGLSVQPKRLILVAFAADEIAGLLVLHLVNEVAELENLIVAPRWRRRGLARRLCVRAMALSGSRGATVMELEVRASNEGALALYSSLGFIQQGRRRAYYLDPSEDAVLMQARLS